MHCAPSTQVPCITQKSLSMYSRQDFNICDQSVQRCQNTQAQTRDHTGTIECPGVQPTMHIEHKLNPPPASMFNKECYFVNINFMYKAISLEKTLFITSIVKFLSRVFSPDSKFKKRIPVSADILVSCNFCPLLLSHNVQIKIRCPMLCMVHICLQNILYSIA